MRHSFHVVASGCIITAALTVASSRTACADDGADGAPLTTPHPILFVTQVPIPNDFTTVGSTFGNHLPMVHATGRGGDLWIRYEDGTLRNLTAEAGYGSNGFQGSNAIAVREPCVHWSGDRAVFSMVIGAPTEQYVWETYHWQLYEVTGLGAGERVSITKVPQQPEDVNNVSPIYASDDSIIFTSDRPITGAMHLYPQLDEYESARVVSGIWRLDPAGGALDLLMAAPSGAFSPVIDAHGRVIFTVWDHLQRDQQTDAFWMYGDGSGSYNLVSEAPGAASAGHNEEVFPEPRGSWLSFIENTPGYGGPPRGYAAHLEGHTLERFQPWQMQQDGTGLELVNHIGRHELATYFNRAFNDDPNLVEFIASSGARVHSFFQPALDPSDDGVLYGINAPTFGTHACGQLVRVTSDPTVNADDMAIASLSHPDTATAADAPSADHSGLYRNPVVLSDGRVITSHTAETRADANDGSTALPQSRYDLRLTHVAPDGAYWTPAGTLTGGITKAVSYWNPDVLVSYDGPLWELDPVEVRPRAVPPAPGTDLPAIERQVLADARISEAELRNVLIAEQLALVVSRDVTTRDAADRQQPFNLRVPGGTAQTLGAAGRIYDVSHLQFVQGDLIRAYESVAGRRTIGQFMHDAAALALNPASDGPAGSVRLGADGSMAALIPASRAVSWQLTDPAGDAVVRERYWMSFRPGEMRSCTSCHGVNTVDQAGVPEPTNEPDALRDLLDHLVAQGTLTQYAVGDLNYDGVVDFGDLLAVLAAWGVCPDPVVAPCAADLDDDGSVGFSDLLLLLGAWTA